MSIGHLARTPLTVYRPGFVDDGMGGQTPTFAEVGQIRGQVSQPTAEEKVAAGQFGAKLSHVVHAVAGVDVQRLDELDGPLPSTVGPGRRLRVVAVTSNSRTTYRRIECEITQPQGA
jgi:hypothetical protein